MIYDDASPQNLQRLTRMAICLGILTVLGSVAIGYIAYRTSWNAILDGVLHHNLAVARLLGKSIEALEQSASDTQVIDELQRLWNDHDPHYPGSYLCMTQSDATLRLHTARPKTVGTDVGGLVLRTKSAAPQTVRDLIAARQDWVGYLTTATGERQVASFAYLPRQGGLLAIHVPAAEIESQIRTTALPWAGGLGVITGVLLPIALGLLHRAYTSSQRATARALTTLRVSEAQFRKLIEHSMQGIVIHRHDKALFANQAFADLFGYAAPEEILHLDSLLPLATPHEHERLRSYHQARIAGEPSPPHYELQGVRRDGSWVWLEMHVQVINWDGQAATQTTLFDMTERKHAMQALQESEAQFRLLTDSLPVRIIYVDRDLRYRFVNKTCEVWFDRQASDILGCTVPEIFGEHYHKVEPLIHRALAGETFRHEIWFPFRDGKERFVSTIYVPHTSTDAEVLGYFALSIDNTAHKRVETALRESESRYRTLVDQSQQGILIVRHWKALFANPALATILGYERPEDFIGQDIRQHLDSREQVRLEACCQARRQGEPAPAHYEVQFMKRGGEFILLDNTVSLITWDGALASMITLIDITQRKQAEAALRESEARYRLLAENVSDVIWVRDFDLRPVYTSPSVTRMRGFSVEEAMAQSLDEALTPESTKVARQALARELALEQSGQGAPNRDTTLELEATCKDGSTVWIETRTTFLRDANGRPNGIVGVNRDISERKQAEAERRQLEEQLRQSHKMEAMGTLAGGIAHDFNNMLGVIFIHAEMAQMSAQPGSELGNNLQNILTSAKRAKELVQQILTFSRQTETRRQPVYLTTVIQDTLTFLRASLPATIDIRYELPDSDTAILADSTQLHQIVFNLCSNAEYAMRETGGILEITVERVDIEDDLAWRHPELQPGPHVCLTIRDSGQGMTPAVMARIFDPFFTTKGVSEGTGMGLALVHGMVANHQGAITVESTPGTGTAFAIYFPLTWESVEESPPRDGDLPQGTARILFVDDEPELVRPVTILLEQLGYEVVASSSSPEALERFRTDPQGFDLLITDQTMPHMTGEQLTQAVREVRPDLPIILCTGFSHLMHPEKARTLGIDAFCMKPLTAWELATSIQQVLSQRDGLETRAKRRILLVDDDDQLRHGLRQILEGAGYTVVEARNGREGMRQYRTAPADLIIMDLLMPEQEGMETIGELTRDFPEAKIIAISGGRHSGDLNLHVAQQLGAQGTLRKPFSGDELLLAIRKVFG